LGGPIEGTNETVTGLVGLAIDMSACEFVPVWFRRLC
jgi:hypothetical protein